MEDEYKYQVRTDGIYRIHVEEDDDPWNPRTDQDGNIGTMFCQHSRYQLGDRTEYNDAYGMKAAILKELNIPMKRVENRLRAKTEGVRLSYNRSEKIWQLYGGHAWINGKQQYGVVDEAESLSYLEDSIIEYLPMADLIVICGDDLVMLPLYLYDHTGITMNTTGFLCPWDSGQVGYIWTTIKKAMEITGIVKDSQKEMKKWILESLQTEVSLYDQYLTNDCYGYIIEKYEDGEWTQVDSCWGFYCSQDPLKEISTEVFGDNILNEFPASA